MRAIGLCLLGLAASCGGETPRPKPPPPPPGLTAAEAARLPECIEALDAASGTRPGAASIALACAPECDLEVPSSIARYADELIAFVAGRCARSAPAGQSTWHLAKLAGAWAAGVRERAGNSHPELAARLDEVFERAEVPLLLESRARGLFTLPPAARSTRAQTEVYVLVTRDAVHAGITGWAGFSERGARRKVGFGGSFPGVRVRLRGLRELATRLHATISDSENATAEDRAPLLLADRDLDVARVRRVVRRLGRARLGVARRGLAAEHQTHLNWIDRWSGTWLLFRPSRTLVRTGSERVTVPHRGGEIDWPGVRAALAGAGGGDLAIDPPPGMTVRELTVVLDQITADDSDPSLYFTRRPDLEPALAIESIEVDDDRIAATIVRRYLDRAGSALLDCYRPALATDDRAEGTAAVRFTIGTRGDVTASEVETTLGQPVAACVDAAVEAIRFPRPRGRQTAGVAVVLGFSAG